MTDRSPHDRALEGIALGMSISESEETTGLGITAREVNRTVREVAGAVLAQGGQVVFGHDWREGGVMEAVLSLAIEYHDSAREADRQGPAMTNFVPWPDRSTVSAEDRQRYHGVLEIVETGAPEIPAGVKLPPGPAADPLRRTIALTEMRHRMTGRCDARLCMGGRTTGFQGRAAGILEEAALTLAAGKPLYVTGLFGGASAEVIRALTGRPYATPEVAEPGPALTGSLSDAGVSPGEAGLDPGLYDRILRDTTPETLAGRNGLSVEENGELFEARSLTEVIALVLKGLSALRG